MKAVNEGRIGITDSVMRPLGPVHSVPCLRGGVPIGVPYGNLIEATMQQVADKRKA